MVAAVDACLPTCEVVTVGDSAAAFVPRVAFVASGSTLHWRTTDSFPHTASDRADLCLHVEFSRTHASSALFFVADGGLWAASEGGEPQPCASATATPDGAFVLPYECFFHPQMRAHLVVR